MYAVRVVGLCLLATAIVSGQYTNNLFKTSEALTGVLLQATSEDRFNYVTSPLTSSVILAMMAEGAEAETKSQLVEAMGGEFPDKDSYKELLTSIKSYSSDGNAQNRVVLKNFLYVYKNYSVLESFAELARDYYLADVRSVARPDLAVMRAANNDGTDTATDVTADDENTSGFKEHAMLMFNGFSLDMSWPTSTWHKATVSWNGKIVRAFGAAGNFAIGQLSSIDSTVLKLPYKNTDYALLVLKPNNKDIQLEEVMEKLNETSFEELTKVMSIRPAFVTMPCFQSSNITYLKTVLKEFTQVKNVFTDSADLSKLSSDKLYLDDVVQQAGIKMCIDGATSSSLTSTYHRAAASRAVPFEGLPSKNKIGSAFSSQRVYKETVVMDRSFMYALYNVVNKVIYVAGKLEQPIWEEEETIAEENVSDIEVIKM